MPDLIYEIVESLPNMKNVNEIYEIADRRLHAGEASFVGDLGVALSERIGGDQEDMLYRRLFGELFLLLAVTPSSGGLVQALRLFSAAPSGGSISERYAASLLAASQSPEDLSTVVFTDSEPAGDPSEELRACLVHELVLRGVAVSELPDIAKWLASPYWRRHPLAWLPLGLSEIERKLDLPSYSVRAIHQRTPYGPWADKAQPAPLEGPGIAFSAEVTTDALAASISTAVMNWTQESNGRIEARAFEYSQPISVEAVPATLLTSGLRCLRGRKPTSASPVSVCTPAEAWRLLFAAASWGGAYSSKCYGAYGRLSAWQSLAGLAGMAEGATAAEVAEHGQQCSWYRFEVDTPWFNQVMWDFGLAALDPSRSLLTVLAATDTS